jgi:hypothetical protein
MEVSMKILIAALLVLSLNSFAQSNESDAAKEGLYYTYVANWAALQTFRVQAAGALAAKEAPASLCLMIGEASATSDNLETLREVQNITGLEIHRELNDLRLANFRSQIKVAANHCRFDRVSAKSVRERLQLIVDAFDKP